jgi:nucleoside 2-deoxyribosyltransferase
MGWITVTQGSKFELTPHGWEEVQRRPRIESAQGFVAMWFGGKEKSEMMGKAYHEGFRAAIEDECHYQSLRIDGKEFNGDIVDEIMAEIRESRFVVADLTGHRGGVYFEGGFARGLGIPVIWTCHVDDAENTHFDTNHEKQIRWNDADELKTLLSNRIRATVGPGPKK